MGDDGLGMRVIDELEKEDLPNNVELYSGDTSGLDLLKVFPGHDKVIIIDAADMGEDPGAIRSFSFDEIKKADFKDVISTHGMGLLETLTIAEKIDLKPEIIIIGVQPEMVSHSLELSPLIKGKIPERVEKAKSLVYETQIITEQ